MGRKALPLLAGLAAVAVLSAATVVVTRRTAAAAASSSASTVTVFAADSDVNKISYTPADADTVDLVLNGDTWQWTGDAAFPLEQSYPEAMADLLKSVQATSLVVDSASDSAAYGFDAPANTITATHADGSAETYLLGATNSHTGETYLMQQGKSAVYTVSDSFVTAFHYALDAMLKVESWGVTSADELDSVTLTHGGETYTLSVTRAENADSTETKTYTVTLADGTTFTPNADAAADFLENAAKQSFSGCVNYKGDSAFVTSCGLDNGGSTATLTLQYTKDGQSGTFTVDVGNGSDTGVYFAKQPDSTAVNTIDGATLALLLNTTSDTLRSEPNYDTSTPEESDLSQALSEAQSQDAANASSAAASADTGAQSTSAAA